MPRHTITIADFALQHHLRKPQADTCGDLNITGKLGTIYQYDARLLAATVVNNSASGRYWCRYRDEARDLGCRIIQNGDPEGTFLFDPSNAEQAAHAIRAIRAPKKRTVSPETAARLRQNLQRNGVSQP